MSKEALQSLVITEEEAPLALHPGSHFKPRQARLYIDPSGDCCGWRRTAFEWMALCVAARGKREANKRKKDREGRLCDLDVKTDRRLMGSSIFRCSDEALEHADLKYL